MAKLKTIIDLFNQGDKAKLWKYLNKGVYSKKDKINVMKNSTQSEGGQGGGGNKPAFRYFDITNLGTNSAFGQAMGMLAHLVKQHQLGTGDIQFTNALGYFEGYPIAVAVYLDFPAPKNFQNQAATCGALLDTLPPDLATMMPEITEEEFYNLNV